MSGYVSREISQFCIARVECGMILESGPNSTRYSFVFYMSSMSHSRGVQSFKLNYSNIFTFSATFPKLYDFIKELSRT